MLTRAAPRRRPRPAGERWPEGPVRGSARGGKTAGRGGHQHGFDRAGDVFVHLFPSLIPPGGLRGGVAVVVDETEGGALGTALQP
jgi:hypothetical protein